ncbi:MAG: alternate-type signal peptide domain-containing protein [Actinomycetia bacterium]|nr:alternate-type signal peptide domain-containing protein [Actinomycetes bacterium]
MSTNDTAVVVVTEEKKRRRGLIWIAGATAALMLGGGTFALWSANDSFNGGSITAGDLNITKVENTTYWDVSTDRKDADQTVPGTNGKTGHAIDSIATWRIVPGDKVAAVFSTSVTLEGDNMVGKLSVKGFDAMTDGNASLTWSYQIFHEAEAVAAETALPADGNLLYLSAPGTGQDSGLEDADGTTVRAMTDKTENLTIVIYGTFAATAGNDGKTDKDANGVYSHQSTDATGTRQDATKADILAKLLVQLDQVRDTGAQFAVN